MNLSPTEQLALRNLCMDKAARFREWAEDSDDPNNIKHYMKMRDKYLKLARKVERD